MCGVFGVVNASLNLQVTELRDLIEALLIASEIRGSEAAGVVAWSDAGLTTRKTDDPPHRFVQQPGFRDVFEGITGPEDAAVIGHARLVTNGSAIYDENNQPITCGRVTLVHNGIVTNYSSLDGSPGGDSDTAAIASFLESKVKDGAAVDTAVRSLFAVLNGSATIAVIDDDSGQLALGTNTGSLYLALADDRGVAAFASERRILEHTLRSRSGRRLGQLRVEHVRPGSGVLIERATGSMRPFTLEKYSLQGDGHYTAISSVVSTHKLQRGKREPVPEGLAGAIQKTQDFVARVRRCRRCVLPETIPFITFDKDGICSYCRPHEPRQVRAPKDLERLLAPVRSIDGPNCIVAFSGGRDSSFGLHLLVNDYGLRPLALTYDWGMVTDLARRNQARMTGALGVEHVLVSADIARKRRNIGANLRAWIHNPHLGMLPLLMAGDKQFFLHTRNLSRDTGIPLVVFCINPWELTFFKAGFAGVANQRYYTSSTWLTKGQLFGFYASQFIKNPRYVNRSLSDTVEAAYATYVKPHEYLQLFEWIDWDEDAVNQTLTQQYGWETDPSTTTTWRIGDGTAPFYNYVYWRTVGFTESDTFRSNQVREGKITRERALELVMSENEPRWERIAEYLDLVDVDFDQTVRAIEVLASRSAVGSA